MIISLLANIEVFSWNSNKKQAVVPIQRGNLEFQYLRDDFKKKAVKNDFVQKGGLSEKSNFECMNKSEFYMTCFLSIFDINNNFTIDFWSDNE